MSWSTGSVQLGAGGYDPTVTKLGTSECVAEVPFFTGKCLSHDAPPETQPSERQSAYPMMPHQKHSLLRGKVQPARSKLCGSARCGWRTWMQTLKPLAPARRLLATCAKLRHQ
eukprot:1162115-Pelagomonas_calceolata.AAC.13